MTLKHGIHIDSFSKLRLHRNAGDLNAVARHTERLHVDFIILLRHKIPVERAGDPESVKVKIGNHYPQARIEFPV